MIIQGTSSNSSGYENLLVEMGISQEDVELIVTYVESENPDENILNRLSKFDVLPSQNLFELNKYIKTMIGKKRYKEAKQLAMCLFAMGNTDAIRVIPDTLYPVGKQITESALYPSEVELPIEVQLVLAFTYGVKRCSVYHLGYYDEVNYLDYLKAAKLCKDRDDVIAGMLYAVYFLKKYPTELFICEKKMESSSLIGRLKDKLSGNQDITGFTTVVEKSDIIEADDLKSLKEYEDIVCKVINTYLIKFGFPKVLVDQAQASIAASKYVRNLKISVPYTFQIRDAFMRMVILTATNYMLSRTLHNAACLVMNLNTQEVLRLYYVNDIRQLFKKADVCFLEELCVDQIVILKQAAFGRHYNTMKYYYDYHNSLFWDVYNKYDTQNQNVYEDFLMKYYPEIAKKIINDQDNINRVYDELLEVVKISSKNSPALYNILHGEGTIEDMIAEGKKHQFGYSWYSIGYAYDRNKFKVIKHPYFERFVLLSVLFSEHSDLVAVRNQDPIAPAYELIKKYGLGFEYLIDYAVAIRGRIHYQEMLQKIDGYIIDTFEKELVENSDSTVTSFAKAGADGRVYGLKVLGKYKDKYKDAILAYADDSSKAVKEVLIDILKETPEWENDIAVLAKHKKQGVREVAYKALFEYNTDSAKETLKNAYEVEKSDKLRMTLMNYLSLSDEGVTGEQRGADDIVESLHKGGKSRTLAWLYESEFSEVHDVNGKLLDDRYMQAILLGYSTMNPLGISPLSVSLAANCNKEELEFFMQQVYQRWMEKGADFKKKWVLYATSVHGGSNMMNTLYSQIKQWPEEARGAAAAEAVYALALNPDTSALLIVDGMARKFKFKQVKTAAGLALTKAAEQIGITREELEDRIVPTLGFDENFERVFDYGNRQFVVTLSPDLELLVATSEGKKVKTLPAPGKTDDEEKSKAAYQEFKDMKKQMTLTVKSQKARLDVALAASRCWSKEAWINLFVKNPVMHQFAIGLIWGTYVEGKLVDSFRYMEDGSFNTKDEDEYELGEDAKIGLVHPIELDKESLDTWKEQLSDYEITQPIVQLDREVFHIEEEEKSQKHLNRFKDIEIMDYTILTKMTNLGWNKGIPLDGGCIDAFYRVDTSVGLAAHLFLEGCYVAGCGEDTKLEDVVFTTSQNFKTESYSKDGDKDYLWLGDIPERYFSEIVLQLINATKVVKE